MAKFECEVACAIDELIQLIDEQLDKSDTGEFLCESLDFQVGNRTCSVRTYQRFPFPSADQDVITLFFAEGDCGTYLAAVDQDGGYLDCFRNDCHLPAAEEGYFLGILKSFLAKYQLSAAG